MFIKLQDYYLNLDHVAEFWLNSTEICVERKNCAYTTRIKYKTKAEAEAAYEAIGTFIIEFNNSKRK